VGQADSELVEDDAPVVAEPAEVDIAMEVAVGLPALMLMLLLVPTLTLLLIPMLMLIDPIVPIDDVLEGGGAYVLTLLLMAMDPIVPIDDVLEGGGAYDTIYAPTAPGTLVVPVTEFRSVQFVPI
jgi:hypothetical protein